MQQYQTRVRKMRRPGQHHGRSTDGIRQTYYNPAIRAAREAAERTKAEHGQDSEQERQS